TATASASVTILGLRSGLCGRGLPDRRPLRTGVNSSVRRLPAAFVDRLPGQRDGVLGRGSSSGSADQVAPTETRSPSSCHFWLLPFCALLRPADPRRLFLACFVGQF